MVQGEPVIKGRILYIGGFDMPDRNAAAHRVLNNAKIFRFLGYETVFCGMDKDMSAAPEKVCGFDNLPVAYPQSSKQWFLQLLDIGHYIKTIEKYGDIKLVMCYNLHALPLIRLIRFCKKRGIKIAADCTEWYENKPSFNPVKMIKCIDTALAMHAQKKLDGMMAITSYLESYYKPFVPVMLRLPPLVDVTDQKWTERVDLPSGCARIVYTGSPGDTKDKLGQIVRLLSKTQADFEFNVIGITEDQFKATFSVSEISDKVRFLGRVSHEESIRALRQADYCVFVRDRSRKNAAGFPTKFVESYTSGTGIIANDISDIKNYFPNDGISILTDTADDLSIQNALCAALEKDMTKVRENRRNGTLSNSFDIKENIKSVESFLSELGL